MTRLPVSLTVEDHRRDAAGMTYVYPVLSRRAGGISIGINLNPNNACNWRCVYCQVPDLRRGGPPPIDLRRLESEVDAIIGAIADGSLQTAVDDTAARRVADVAFSGNGEPLSAKEFPEALAVVDRVLTRRRLDGMMRRVITNGSLVDRPWAVEGLARLGDHGEAWFKVDSATVGGLARINGTRTSPGTVLRRLKACARLCRTWVQTCVFACDGHPPDAAELAAYLALLGQAAP
ncbi:MAG: radical SAM protein, partial [Rhodocyclaceae bacterium]|nr:radical SAM protein [Rhodocyclaceae bacterium]